MKVARKLWTWALALVATFAVVLGLSTVAMAAAGDTPPHTKNITDNQDGTYTISLDIVGESEKKPNNVNVIVIMDTSGSMNAQRMNAAKNAVNSLADSLYAYNTTENPNTVEMALVRFSTTESIAQGPTNSATTFRNAVNGLPNTGEGGTNWEGALQIANTVNFNDDDQTFVIFVSDGNPTFRYTEGNYPNHYNDYNADYYRDYRVWGSGSDSGYGSGTTIARCYEHAVDDAIVLANKVTPANFFTIGAFGNVDRMESLTGDAGSDSSTNYYSAQDTAALNQAIADILAKIEVAGFADAEIDDGTTSQVTTTSGEVANLLVVDESSYKYYRSGGSYGSMQQWADAPKAHLVNGTVEWDLSEVGVLENDVRYTVTFDCYPSQTTYDIIAQLKNGDIKYSELDSEIQKYIVDNDNGSYSLSTNTNAGIAWDDTRDSAGRQTSAYKNPDPVKTESSTLTATKEWEGGEPDVDSLEITVLMDDKPFHSAKISKDNGWSTSSFISPGIIKNNQALPGAEGHDFKFAELGSEQYHWELESPVVHPMLIDGELTMLIMVDKDHPLPSGATTYTINSNTYYVDTDAAGLTAVNHRRSNLNLTKVVTGEDAPKDATFPFTLTVKNSKAPATAPEDDPEHNSDYWVWFSIYDTKAGAPVMDATVSGATGPNADGYYYAPSNSDITVQMKDGWNLRFTNLPSGTTYTFAEGTLPEGFAFNKAELTQGEDSTFKGAQTTTGTIENTKTSYTVTYTNDYQLTDLEITKVWSDANNQDGIRLTADELAAKLKLSPAVQGKEPTVTDNGDGTYTITYTGLPRFNNGQEVEYQVTESAIDGYTTTGSPAKDHGTITNTHTPEVTSVKVTKVWDDSNDAGKIRPTSVSVQLTADGVASGDPVTLNEGNEWTYTWENLPKYKNGTAIVYAADETEVPTGYTKTVTGDAANGITITNKYTPTPITASFPVKKTISVPDGLTGPTTWSYTINVTANNGAPVAETMSGTVSNTTDTVTFGDFTFTMPGTYTYAVSESGDVAGVTNDPETSKTVTVTVEDDGEGGLTASVSPETGITFNNTYNASGEATITVSKALAGAAWPEGKTLTLTLAAEGDAPLPETTTATLSATGSVSFGPISYSAPGTYTYTVSEDGFGAGWTGSGDITVTVKVEDKGDGTLVATPSYSPSATITNTYKPNGTEVDTDDATTGVFLTKAYSVADGLTPAGKTFEFSIAEVDAQGNAVEGGYSATGSAAYAAGDTSEAVDLGTITYTEPGTHYYKVAETTDDGGGWTKSGDGYTVTVTVTDQGDGTLRAAVSGTGTITNTYKPSEATAYIPVEKIMSVPEGLSAADLTGKFTFTLTADEGTPMPETTSYTNPDANGGTVTFGSIAYTQPGTYNYTVTESGSADGVTNDPKAAKTVTVDVKDNGDGTLSATSSSTTDAPLTFTNTLVPAKLDEETNTAVKVTKTLYGRDSKPGETFTFTMSPADSATVDAVKTGAIKLENDTATVSNAKDGQPADAAFGSMTFAQVGTYTFNVSEDKGTEAGMSYDADVKTLTVTVTDQGGKLVAVPEGDLSFTNTYTASGSYTPQGTKQLLGNPTEPATDEDNATPEEHATNNEQKQNETADVQNTEKSAASNAESDAVSPKEDAAEPAEAEKADESAAVEEQPASSDTATTESADATAAEDTAQTTADINPVAALLAPTQANAAEPEVVTTTGSFAFFVTYANGNAGSGLAGSEASRGTATVEYGKIANIAFNSISYKTGRADEAGTLEYLVANGAATKNADGSYDITYLVKENKTSDPFQLNTQTFTFTVHVVDNGNGTLAASLAEGSSAIAFVNHYLTADVTVSMSGLKVMNGTRSIEAGDYSFTIKGSDGAPMPAEATVKNAAGGSVDFGTITFTKDDLGSATEKTFTYTITEDEGDKPGVSYSDEAQTVTVTVKDNGNGTLSATTNPATTPLFTITNTYTPTPNQSSVTDQIKITKELTGRDLTAGEFTFQLKDASGNVVSEATNAADGTITFAPVSFTAAGDYTYQISELDNGVAGVTYDAISSYSVTAHVVDHFDGKPLEVTWTYGGGSQITFKNSYSSDPGTSSVTDFVKITKELTGRDLTAGEFTFQLKDADGNVVSTATNAADGTIIFNPITFTEVGTYTYTVSEVNSGADNITYDDSVYTVTATVTDNGDGTKSVVWSYEGGSIVFKNTYTAPAAPEPAKPAEAKPVKTPDTSDTNAGSMAFGAITVAGIVALGVGIALKRREH